MKKDKSTSDIKFTPRFKRQLNNASDDIIEAFFHSLDIFLEDMSHPSLRNHALKKDFSGYRSIDVTADWRALFKEGKSRKRKVIIFHMLGTHKELYG